MTKKERISVALSRFRPMDEEEQRDLLLIVADMISDMDGFLKNKDCDKGKISYAKGLLETVEQYLTSPADWMTEIGTDPRRFMRNAVKEARNDNEKGQA